MKKNVDLLIVGGGSAGLAAAIEAKNSGVDSILILEREAELGGILKQCIHNGFGLHTFKEELTGPEYADRFVRQVEELGIEYLTGTMVLELNADKTARAINESGLLEISAKAVILAMGCRERPRGALVMPGTRPAGVYTAGTAQKLVNRMGYLPGKRVVILGSGDIGLIMARRFTLEGAKVEAVVELMPYSSGLARNIAQCLNDFDIPLLFSHTVVDIKGNERVQSVTIAQVDKNRRPMLETSREIECDTLLLSCGLLPETELVRSAGLDIDRGTRGAVVDDSFMTSVEGIFTCGNVLHVHDLVDNVSAESAKAGRCAADYIGGKSRRADHAAVKNGKGVMGAVPQRIGLPCGEPVTVMFRPTAVFKGAFVTAAADGKEIFRQKKVVLAPGEMAEIVLKSIPDNAKEIEICVEGGDD